jgi:tetratricopeptide (TPR) repeat protein
MTHPPLTRETIRIALLALCLFGALTPREANAEDDATRGRLFDEALTAAQAGRWEEALVVYERLWNERRAYDVALLLGQAEYNLKRYRAAAEHLSYGLGSLPASGSPQVAERSRQILDLCKEQVGTLNLQVKNKGAEILINGEVIAEAPLITPVFVNPGEHRFEVRLAGHVPERFTMMLEAKQSKSRSVELKPLVPEERSVEPAPKLTEITAPPAPPESHASWTPVIVGGIVTLAGLSAGVAFEFARQAADDRATRIRDGLIAKTHVTNPCLIPVKESVSECNRILDGLKDYDRYGKMELVSFIVSGAALVGTGGYFLLARPDQASSARRGMLGPLHVDARYGKGSGYLGISTPF